MKKIKSIVSAITCLLLMSGITLAAASDEAPANGTSKVMMPVYKTLRDCDITYYIIKINNENVLMDNKGKVIKYLCEDDKLMKPERYQVLNIPKYLLVH